eukprot:TRINITY_DN10712_c0_g1_i1.p1 TRINITY_DN10712_c0_g1~~TRINITY_DN10712_c0_g1_i1.p1  ORF type:complete len:231 (-),score=26.80 TRINITY_DN10712_c0_g1_i1:13-705(-)
MGSQRRKQLTVHFGFDCVDVFEFSIDQMTGHQRLDRKGKSVYIFGEPSPELNAGDILEEQDWMYYYSALKQRMHEAKGQLDWMTLKQARSRASRLKKRLNDPDDESHLGMDLPKTVTEAVESADLPGNAAGGNVASNRKAPLPCYRLASLWSAPRSAMRMPPRFCKSSAEKIPPANDADPDVPLTMWYATTPERLRIIADRTSTSSTRAQRHRMFKCKNEAHSLGRDPSN